MAKIWSAVAGIRYLSSARSGRNADWNRYRGPIEMDVAF